MSRDITVIRSFINQTICHNDDADNDDDTKNTEKKKKKKKKTLTTQQHTAQHILNSNIWVLLKYYQYSKRYNYKEYSFGIITIILRTNDTNESIEARNWINGVNEIQGLKGLKNTSNGCIYQGEEIRHDTMLDEQRTEEENRESYFLFNNVWYCTHVSPIDRHYL